MIGVYAVALLMLSGGGTIFACIEDFESVSSNLSAADLDLSGENWGDLSGYSVAAAGDVNGDGYADILISALNNNSGGHDAGATYLLLGSPGLLASGSVSLADADYVFIGENEDDLSGVTVAGAGDVDGDGLDDILVGAYGNSDAGLSAGKAYLLLGASIPAMPVDSDGQISLSDSDYAFVGENSGDTAGAAVAGAGDVDGDGLDDILIGAPENGDAGASAGKVYLVLAAHLSAMTADADGNIGLSGSDYAFVGENEDDSVGWAVAGVGDVDGDGLGDILFGASGNDDAALDAGKSYLVLGASLASLVADTDGNIGLSQADYGFVGEAASDWSGYSLSGAGDVDGDGLDDILIGAFASDFLTGKAYLILAGGLSALTEDADGNIGLSQADYRLVGDGAQEFAGYSVSGAGDVDGDGLDDILIGCPSFNDIALRAGRACLFLGSSLATITPDIYGNIFLAHADYFFNGEAASDYAGFSVSGAGDVDGDGWDEVLIGAPYNAGTGSLAGRTYMLSTCGDYFPTAAVYVDADLGTSAGPGGSEAPFDTIAAGIDAADDEGISTVYVRAGTYAEVVELREEIELIGVADESGNLPVIEGDGSTQYVVEGAAGAAIRNFFIEDGGIRLDRVEEMTVQGNVVFRSGFDGLCLLLTDESNDNVVKNNLFFRRSVLGFAHVPMNPAAVRVQSSSNSNYFVNNTVHLLCVAGGTSPVRPQNAVGVFLGTGTSDNGFWNNIVWVTSSAAAHEYGFYGQGSSVTAQFAFNKTPANNYGVTLAARNLCGPVPPGFADPMPGGTDYTLKASSICVDAGAASPIFNDSDKTRNDMGAYGGPTPLQY